MAILINMGLMELRDMVQPSSKEYPEVIAEILRKEFKRVLGLRRSYNPLTLQLIKSIPSIVSSRQDNFLYFIRFFLDQAVYLYGRYYITKSESKKILKEINLPYLLGISRKRIDVITSKFLNDLRRLNIIKLFIRSSTDNVLYKLPIIFPSWRDYITVDKPRLRLTVIGKVNDNVIGISEKRFKDAVFLSFFEGNPIADVIREIYIKYGTFNISVEILLDLVNEKLYNILKSSPYTESNKHIYYINITAKNLKKTLEFIFKLKGVDLTFERNGRVIIPNDVLKEIIKGLKIEYFSYEEYLEALKRAWRKYWKGLPPWYASLENLAVLINQELSKMLERSIKLTLEEHLKYITELARWGKLEYWTGGVDPKRRHWIRLK